MKKEEGRREKGREEANSSRAGQGRAPCTLQMHSTEHRAQHSTADGSPFHSPSVSLLPSHSFLAKKSEASHTVSTIHDPSPTTHVRGSKVQIPDSMVKYFPLAYHLTRLRLYLELVESTVQNNTLKEPKDWKLGMCRWTRKKYVFKIM